MEQTSNLVDYLRTRSGGKEVLPPKQLEPILGISVKQQTANFPPATVSDVVAIFEDHLESFLSSEWPEWLTACQDVESAAGISLAKNQLAYRTATLKAGGTVPEMLMQAISRAKGQYL